MSFPRCIFASIDTYTTRGPLFFNIQFERIKKPKEKGYEMVTVLFQYEFGSGKQLQLLRNIREKQDAPVRTVDVIK